MESSPSLISCQIIVQKWNNYHEWNCNKTSAEQLIIEQDSLIRKGKEYFQVPNPVQGEFTSIPEDHCHL